MSKIKLKRGDDEQYLVQILQENADGSQSSFDLSDTARADLHAKVGGKIELQLSTENGSILWHNRSTGELLLDFAHGLTENAYWLVADYDLQLIDRNGKRKTVLSGRIELAHDVTKVSL